MAAVYKVLSPQYVDAFITGKAIRIGTLYDYRDDEKHLLGIADCEEGKATSTISSTANLKGYERALFQQDIKNLGFIQGPDVHIEMENSSITLNHPDCFVFSSCMTRPNLGNFKNTLSDDNDYGSIVRINDLSKFADMIATALVRGSISTGKYVGGPVSYETQNWDYLALGMKAPNPFEKASKFREQNEHRIVFESKAKTIGPVLVDFEPFPADLVDRIE